MYDITSCTILQAKADRQLGIRPTTRHVASNTQHLPQIANKFQIKKIKPYTTTTMKSSIDKRGEGVPVRAIALLLALLAASCFLQLQPGAEAHVALTYPPARGLDLDFLDNARTKVPCGMPKGKCNGKVAFLFLRYFFLGGQR